MIYCSKISVFYVTLIASTISLLCSAIGPSPETSLTFLFYRSDFPLYALIYP